MTKKQERNELLVDANYCHRSVLSFMSWLCLLEWAYLGGKTSEVPRQCYTGTYEGVT